MVWVGLLGIEGGDDVEIYGFASRCNIGGCRKDMVFVPLVSSSKLPLQIWATPLKYLSNQQAASSPVRRWQYSCILLIMRCRTALIAWVNYGKSVYFLGEIFWRFDHCNSTVLLRFSACARFCHSCQEIMLALLLFFVRLVCTSTCLQVLASTYVEVHS